MSLEVDQAPLPRERRRAVVRQSVSVGVATGAYGVSFGALSVAAGLDIWQTMVLSLVLFSGGSQFAVIGILGAGGVGAAAVATSSMLAIRNGLYALQMNRILGVGGLRRVLAAQVTIDESTAVAVGQAERPAQRLGFWLTGASVYVFWNLCTLAGAVLGNAIGDPATYGLDAAAGAAFIALLWPRLTGRDPRVAAVAAAGVALVLAPFTPVGVPVLVAASVAVVVGWRAR